MHPTMFLSERFAEWMGLIALCPPVLRERYEADYVNQTIDDMHIAQKLKDSENDDSGIDGRLLLAGNRTADWRTKTFTY